MKNYYLFLTLLSFVFPPTLAFAGKGGSDGGGGNAIKCLMKPEISLSKDVNGNPIASVNSIDQKYADSIALSHGRKYQLADLWEAEMGYGPFLGRKLKVKFDDITSVELQIESAIGMLYKLKPSFAKRVEFYINLVRAKALPLQDISVFPTQDTDIHYLKKGCSLEGLGYYSDRDNSLVIDPEIRSALSKTDEAAFFLHEAIYKLLRDKYKEQDSWRTRHIVGMLFSEESYTWQELWSVKQAR